MARCPPEAAHPPTPKATHPRPPKAAHPPPPPPPRTRDPQQVAQIQRARFTYRGCPSRGDIFVAVLVVVKSGGQHHPKLVIHVSVF